jgi:hypothetical protein
MTKLRSLLFAAACALGTTVQASTLFIDFDNVPGVDGKLGTADDTPTPADQYPGWIREEFAQVGVYFTVGSMARAEFFDGNANNVFLTSTLPEATFDMPVYGIALDSNSHWNATLTAYDVDGNIVASNQLVNNTGGFLAGTLSVTSSVAIRSFAVTADVPGYILNLDNLSLNLSPVPEPTQALLLGAGLLLVGAAARRKSR